MAPTPKPPTGMPYVWAGVVLFLIAALFVVALLWLRPTLDPLLLITAVGGIFGTMFTGISAYLKSQETHATVNSQLSAWKEEFAQMEFAKGRIEGARLEQSRVAEQARVAALTVTAVLPAQAAQAQYTQPGATPSDPLSVVVENADPVRVRESGGADIIKSGKAP